MKNIKNIKSIRKITAVILSAMIIMSILSLAAVFNVSAAVDSKPNPAGGYLKFTVDVHRPEGETLSFNFLDIKKIEYTVADGDMLEYDVWISVETNGFGAVDANGVTNVGPNNLRDVGGLEDQNGVGMHTGRDMSEYAYDQWYHRVIDLSVEDLIGQTIDWFQIACHPQDDEPEYQCIVLYDNIVITNGGAEKLVIFRDTSDWDGTIRQSHRKDSTAVLEALTFTDEEIAAFKAAEEAKAAEQASREASREAEAASREASREQASIEASIQQAEEDAAAAAEAEGGGDDGNEASKDDGEGSNMTLIIGIIGGAILLVIIIIILVAVTGKKKEAGEDKKEEE